jgi:Leu/Phe-tRNA-protein transferase
MFHLASNAGSVAFYYLIAFCKSKNIELIDAQMHTVNMEKYGGKFISFKEYEKFLHV